MATEVTHGSVKKVVFAWTADSSGDASETTSAVYDGEVLGLTTVPDGSNAPSDNYDVALNDEDGYDVLLGGGVDRDTANTEHVDRASLGAVAVSKLSLVVSNAGNGGQGTVIVWIR